MMAPAGSFGAIPAPCLLGGIAMVAAASTIQGATATALTVSRVARERLTRSGRGTWNSQLARDSIKLFFAEQFARQWEKYFVFPLDVVCQETP